MKKILLTALAGITLTTAASAVQLDNHFYKYGYTKPSVTLHDVQKMIDNGISYNHDGLFAKKLKKGTAIPSILNANRILNALHSKKKVIVASDRKACLPVFEEIARQNGIKCEDLLTHLDVNAIEGEDLFSNIQKTLKDIDQKVSEMINDDVNEEVSNEVSNEISNEVMEEVMEETMREIEEEVENEIEEEIQTIEDIINEAFADPNSELSTLLTDLQDAAERAVPGQGQAFVDSYLEATIEAAINNGATLDSILNNIEQNTQQLHSFSNNRNLPRN